MDQFFLQSIWVQGGAGRLEIMGFRRDKGIGRAEGGIPFTGERGRYLTKPTWALLTLRAVFQQGSSGFVVSFLF